MLRTFILLAFMFMTMSLIAQCPPNGSGGALINEISNLSSQGEFVEFVVVGDPANPTANVDLSGWIIDDNNSTLTGNGNAAGYAILGSCLSSVPPGSIIVLYDDSNTPAGINPANDGTPNSMGIYQIPISSPCISGCASNPSATGTVSATYLPCTTPIPAGSMTWGPITMANGGDVMQIYNPTATLFHALFWDGVNYPESGNGNSVEVGETSLSNESVQLGCGSWLDLANYNVVIGSSTPGAANDADNMTLINSITAGTACLTDGSGGLSPTACDAVSCPDLSGLTAGMLDVQVTESQCTTTGGTTGQDAPGMISAPSTSCPAGSSLEYSLDNFATAGTATPPDYDDDAAITVSTRCTCDTDMSMSSPVSSVTTVPGTCPATTCPEDLADMFPPAVVVASESSCTDIGGTPSGGVIMAPATSCPAGSTLEYSIDGGTTWTTDFSTISYDQTTAVSITTRCLCDIDTDVFTDPCTVTTAPGECPTCDVNIGAFPANNITPPPAQSGESNN